MEQHSLPSPKIPSQEEVDRRMSQWFQAMELSHTMLMAGLRRKIGPDADLNAAYREWYQNHQERKWTEISKVHSDRLKQASKT